MCAGMWTRWPDCGPAFRGASRWRARAPGWRRFNGVNVIVVRTRVLGIAPQHGFQDAPRSARCPSRRCCRRATTASTASGSSGFRRRASRRRDRPGYPAKVAHRVGCTCRASAARSGFQIRRIAHRHGVDVGALAPRCRWQRAPRFLMPRMPPGARVVDVEVVVRAKRPGPPQWGIGAIGSSSAER